MSNAFTETQKKKSVKWQCHQIPVIVVYVSTKNPSNGTSNSIFLTISWQSETLIRLAHLDFETIKLLFYQQTDILSSLKISFSLVRGEGSRKITTSNVWNKLLGSYSDVKLSLVSWTYDICPAQTLQYDTMTTFPVDNNSYAFHQMYYK